MARFLPRPRFRLLTLFIAITALCTWLSIFVNRIHRQSRAAAVVQRLGGKCEGVWADGPAPLRELRQIWISNASPTLDDLRAICNVDSLTSLSIESCGLSDSAIAAIASAKHWDWLDLDYNDFGDEGIERLSHQPRLSGISASGTRISDAALAHLSRLTSLETLILCETRITDAGLASLKTLKNLRFLHIPATKAGDEATSHLVSLPIYLLDLSSSDITNAGLPALTQMKELRHLALAGCDGVDDDGLRYLMQLADLRGLDIRATHISKGGVEQLRQALPGCSIVVEEPESEHSR